MAVFFLTFSVASGDQSATGLRLRLSFGGPQAAIWKGQFELPAGVQPGNIKVLGFQQDHAGRVYFKENLLVIDLVEPTTFGGIEFEVEGKSADKITYVIKNIFDAGEDQTLVGEFELKELVTANHEKNIGDSPNRIYLERAPGDDIKFIPKNRSLVIQRGEPLLFSVAASSFAGIDFSREKNLDVKVYPLEKPKTTEWSQSATLNDAGEPAEFKMDAQLEPGVYEFLVQIKEPSRIPFSPPSVIAQRIVQFVVVSPLAIKPFSDQPENLELVYESVAGKAEKVVRGRFKPWEKINSSARKLIFNHLPIPAKERDSQDFFEIAPESLQLFPLTVESAQTLLKLEVEYRSPTSMTTDFVMFDRSLSNHRYSEVESVTHQTQNSSNLNRKCELVFWNTSSNPVLMVRNLKADGKLKINKIRVLRISESAQDFKLDTERNRRLFARFTADEFDRLLGTPKSRQKNQYLVDDWKTFYTGGRRLVQLVKASRYQGIVLDVNQTGSGIFPSPFLQFLPNSDTGVFSESGKDPFRKDILELLFCQFDANGLTLIPRIELPAYVAAFESADAGFQKNVRLLNADGTPSNTYNYLNAHVQSYITQAILDVVKRYSHHSSFGGICLNLGANRQLLLGKSSGFNDELVNGFLNQKTIKLASAKSAAAKRNLVAQSHAIEFNSHQTSLATNYFVSLNEEINSICGKTLTIDLSAVFDPNNSHQLSPELRKTKQKLTHLQQVGIDRDALAKAGIGLLMPAISSASLKHADARVEFTLKDLAAQDDKLKSHSIARNISQRVEVANQQVDSTAFENAMYHSTRPDSNFSFRRELVEHLAKNELLFFVDEFELGQRSIQCPSKRIWNSFCNLPNTVFDTVNKESTTSPVIVRTKSIGDKSYFYVLNQSPWPTKVTIVFNSPLVNLRSLDGNFFDSLIKTKTGGTLQLALEPYDLIGCRSDQKELKISDVKYSFPENLAATLNKQKDLLLAKIRFAKTPISLVEPFNPGFDSVDSQSIPIHWNFSTQDSFEVSATPADKTGQTHNLQIRNQSGDKWGWVRSPYLPSRGTGRLSVLISMKATEDQPVPKVRLSIDGMSNGSEYYRFGSFSAEATQTEAARIGKAWKVFAVHFNDVPTDIQKLRVGLDVVGKGTVLVDNVQVFDRWFDAQDKEALTKIVSLAAHNISTGDYLKAHNLMNSYWPRFIEAYESSNTQSKPAGDKKQVSGN